MLKGLTQNEKRAESKSTGPRYSKSVQRYPVGVKGGIVWIHYPVQIEVKLREGSVACLHYGMIILPFGRDARSVYPGNAVGLFFHLFIR